MQITQRTYRFLLDGGINRPSPLTEISIIAMTKEQARQLFTTYYPEYVPYLDKIQIQTTYGDE